MSSYLEIQPFNFDPRPEYPYSLCIKRYTHRDLSAEPADTGAITLILTHGVGLHKEQWEPVLEDLFGLLGTANSIAIGGAKLKIREAWSVELPDCGDSVLLNEKALSDGKGCLTGEFTIALDTNISRYEDSEAIRRSFIIRYGTLAEQVGRLDSERHIAFQPCSLFRTLNPC